MFHPAHNPTGHTNFEDARALVEPVMVVLSVLGAVAINLVVAVNHKPGRYLGV